MGFDLLALMAIDLDDWWKPFLFILASALIGTGVVALIMGGSTWWSLMIVAGLATFILLVVQSRE